MPPTRGNVVAACFPPMSPHPKFGFSCFTAQRLVRPAKGRPGACHAGHWPHVFEEARRLTKSSSARRRGLRFGLGGTRASYSKPRIPAWGGSDERGLRERRGLYRGTPPIRSGRPRVRPGDPPAREPDQYQFRSTATEVGTHSIARASAASQLLRSTAREGPE